MASTSTLPLRARLRRNKLLRRARRASGRWFMRIVGRTLLRLNASTWRVTIENEERLVDAKGEGGGHFMALWHGKMLMGVTHYRGRGYTVLVSQSGDGEISMEMLRSFGYDVIRGSSSRGGARALRTMLEALRRGEVLVITPDGPRGPMHSMNPGLAWMSRATGYGVVPVGFASDRCWRAPSWDRMMIPKPWARVAFHYGAPVFVARDAGEEEQGRATEAIREGLLAAERAAAAAIGPEGRT